MAGDDAENGRSSLGVRDKLMGRCTITEEDYRRAARIRVWRARLRVSQIEVAGEAGMHRTALAKYEGGVRPMSEETFQRILAALQSFEPRAPGAAKSRSVRHNGRV